MGNARRLNRASTAAAAGLVALTGLAVLAPAAAQAARAAQVAPPVTVPAPVTATRAAATAQTGDALLGLFRIDGGECGDEGVESGSWFRMIDPGGGYVENNDSACDDNSWTPLAPGDDGGLRTGAYQPHPDPAFSGTGDGQASRITRPEGFFGVDFATATSEVDPQTGEAVPPPAISHDGDGALGGDLRAFAAAWSGQHFNQGSPKPDGSRPGDTGGPEGTYDAASGRYAVEWSSRIEGGPFNGFTGVWHLTGVFEPSEAPAPSSPAPNAGPAGPSPSAPGAVPAATTGPAAARPQAAAAGASSSLAGTGGTERSALAAALALAGIAGLAAAAAARRRGPA